MRLQNVQRENKNQHSHQIIWNIVTTLNGGGANQPQIKNKVNESNLSQNLYLAEASR